MRLKTPVVKIGRVKIGGNSEIAIQSMTNTDTADAQATAIQCMQLADAGSEMVRITVNNDEAAQAVPIIREILDEKGYKDLPIIGDFHFNGHTLLTKYPDCAKKLNKYRINPGNIGHGKNHDENFETFIKIAIKYNKPVRIGVNWGSLDQEVIDSIANAKIKTGGKKIRAHGASAQQGEKSGFASFETQRAYQIKAMVKSALTSAKAAEKLGLKQNQIVLSAKMSQVPDVIEVYRLLAKAMQKNKRMYAVHTGLTEAGSDVHGIASSSAALGVLLSEGIGDTIRVSLTQAPGEPRTKEVEVCKALLQSMGLRHFRPKVTSCPGCGRTDSLFFQDLAEKVNKHIDTKMPFWKSKYPGIEKLKIAVMGCVVNGPGESKHSDIAIHLPGKNEKPLAQLYIAGRFERTLQGKGIAKEFIEILEKYIEKKY